MMFETVAKFSMGVLLFATIPVGGDASAWSQWGLAGLVVGYTLWRDWQRERRMSASLERHQTWVQNTLIGALERNTVAINRLCSDGPSRNPAGTGGFDLEAVPGTLDGQER